MSVILKSSAPKDGLRLPEVESLVSVVSLSEASVKWPTTSQDLKWEVAEVLKCTHFCLA
jgi:hypothetical protein